MLQRKSIVDQIEVTREGLLQIRIALLIVDGDTEINSRWHRCVLPAKDVVPDGMDGVQMQMDAVNGGLILNGEEPVSQADIDRIKRYYEI